MKKGLVGTYWGVPPYSYFETSKNFPNAKVPFPRGFSCVPWPIFQLAIIYHCTKCNKAKKGYFRENKLTNSKVFRI
ncbi:MAG: hypothetical protein IIA88_10645 [Bacteroidetes bacterium]|nr:hypothetical protein [Bacteroidota bacterium]